MLSVPNWLVVSAGEVVAGVGVALEDRAGVRGRGGQQEMWRPNCGCNPVTVGKWRARFLAKRLDGLVDEDRPGRPASITLDQVEDVLVATLEAKPENATHWSRTSMAQEVGVVRSTIGRIWKDFGLQPHRGDEVQAVHRPAVRREGRRCRWAVPQSAREGRRAVRR